MVLPYYPNAAASDIAALSNSTYYAMLEGNDREGKPTGNWSSLIGIVTAICGNILISVALNTQRYAHIRLRDRWIEKRKALRAAKKRVARVGYGTQNEDSFKERTRAKIRQANTDGALLRGRTLSPSEDEEETAPLLFAQSCHTNGHVSDDPDLGPEENPDHVPEKSYLRSPVWWAGQVMMTVGEAGNFLAYGFAPASIVSPLGVVAIISNCIIAPLFLKEPFRTRDFFGVVIAIAGAVTVALSASNNNPKFGPHEIWGLISTWEFETYLGITWFAIICLMIASNKYGRKSILIDLGLVGLFGTSAFPVRI
jgi:magnesium transporter